MGAFGVPLSGLIASQAQLASISNNLANLDTVGYKDQNTSFSAVFAQSSMLNGVGDPLQMGLGVQSSQTVSNFTDGTQSATGIASNMALTGNGFFMTQTPSGATDYTRAGDFTTNSSGQITTPSGDLLMGYPAANGAVDTTAPLQPIQINQNSILPASATNSFSLSVNLSAATTGTGSFTSTTPIYDSLGNAQQLTINYTKSTTQANTWNYSVNLPTSATGAASTQVASGTLNFNSSGQLIFPTSSITISVPPLADGAAALNLKWNLNDAAGASTITQTSAASATTASTQNGYASGTLASYSVSSNGTITGTYSNGQIGSLGQVALANFANTQGLVQVGGNEYQATAAAGTALIGTAGNAGLGTITGGSVESSNVDVATEFGKMIVAQQAYQANAKSITTMDQIVQTTMQMLAA